METIGLETERAERRASGRWRIGLRLVGLGFLVAALVLPAAQVHSVQLPKIQKLGIVGNDLHTVRGVGAPGQLVGLWVRQRNFKEDDRSPLDLDCPGNTDDWLQFWDLDNVDENGNFLFDGLDLMVLPSGTGFQKCSAGLLTEFVVAFGPLPEEVLPQVHMYNIPNYLNGAEKWVEAEVELADQVGIMITDGPDDKADALGGIDVDEDGADLCSIGGLGCGSRVSYTGSGGTFASPSIVEHDGSVFGIPAPQVDNEFDFILAMLQAHANGGSLLAVAKVPRDEEPSGGALEVNVNVKADINLGCGGSFFDFIL